MSFKNLEDISKKAVLSGTNVFEVVPLNLIQWIITVAISVLPVPVMELQKKLDAKNKDTENNKEEKKNYSFAKM